MMDLHFKLPVFTKSVLVFVGALLLTKALFALPVSASEGTFRLTRDQVDCQGISVWQDDRYAVFGRCHGLIYPYRERLDSYVLWASGEGETENQIISEIDRGIFRGNSDRPFTGLLITAEEVGRPSRPGPDIIVSGPITQQLAPASLESQLLPSVQPQSPTPSPTAAAVDKRAANISRFLTLPVLIATILFVIVIGILVTFRR
ncbi:hypothetical protein A2154_02520 [Candidatus Gottesmanbacteria bacterium RBG_16_43_7]|uniref:Uncharacterized protein n=1 Tax=Candidatus Gottesmanbacteria bacterium RBG_16_43_7 TaxID=1798373 RepID=A0A1F5ZBR8_9BACT|nr:MAG: hypothetical protein A2154_02520 [Candidatus Gottesmanbacteria bacterium RBG_16_43_7]